MKNKGLSEKSALLLLLVISFIWGAGFLTTDLALRNFSTFQTLAIRFLIGAITLTIIFRKRLKTFSKYDIIGGIISGILLALSFGVQVYGQYFSTPSISAFITVTYVVLVPIFGRIFFKTKISKRILFCTVLILIGIVLIGIGAFNISTPAINMPLGILLTIACAFGYAFQVLVVDYYCNNEKFNADPVNLTVSMIWSSFFVSLILAIISYNVFDEKIIIDSDFTLSVLSVIFLGLFSTAFAFLGQNYAQKYTDATKTAIILSLESVFGALLSAVFLNEKFTPFMILGFFIVFCAVLITQISPTSKE